MWSKVVFFFLFLASPVRAALVDDFEKEPWRLRLFEVKPDQAAASIDSGCLKVNYIFDNRGIDGKKVLAEAVVVTRDFTEPLDWRRARGLTVNVCGKIPSLNLWVTELDGDTLVFPVPVPKTEEWARVFIPFDGTEKLLRPWGNGRWDGWAQVKSISFEVTDVPDTKFRNDPKGEVLYLDDVSVVEK